MKPEKRLFGSVAAIAILVMAGGTVSLAQGTASQAPGSATSPTSSSSESPGSGPSRTGTAEQSGAGAGRSGSAAPPSGASAAPSGQSAGINIDAQQRRRVAEALFREQDLARADVESAPNVGATLPRRVTPRELPPSITAIVLQYRGYRYVVVRDEIVIVEPRSRRVATVIARSDAPAARMRVELSPSQRQIVRRAVMQNREARAPSRISASIGQSLPAGVTVQELPATVLSEVPALREFRYVVSEENVYLVSPRDNEVVAVLED